jgi:hypothetical protein
VGTNRIESPSGSVDTISKAPATHSIGMAVLCRVMVSPPR